MPPRWGFCHFRSVTIDMPLLTELFPARDLRFSLPSSLLAFGQARIDFRVVGLFAKHFVDGLLQLGRGGNKIFVVRFDENAFTAGPRQAEEDGAFAGKFLEQIAN